ncbi:DUF6475 domain-containing protein [Leptospirillum ferriphilum]|uniref:DUF6475 domain-containing protein n=1 Tax=Leptospirillum ferriphilum TaxID=178606 RepID=UPI000985895B|nr:DUF6475 domain-containing protein [Leptospirillum ferriphilum]OOH75916.1 hypothetical protein BOX30_11505 [Leptospirillum ferriphilum]
MEPSRYKDFGELLKGVSEMFDREMTETVFKFWIVSLKDYSFQEIVDAFNRFVQTESRMPVLADILRILRGSDEDKALSALIKVEDAMQKHGGYATVVFDDPVIHAVIQELGGWIRTCRLSEQEFVWWKKEFRERYEHHIHCGLSPHQEIPVKLSGIFDQANLQPVVIGDYEKAVGWVSKMKETRSLSSDLRMVI